MTTRIEGDERREHARPAVIELCRQAEHLADTIERAAENVSVPDLPECEQCSLPVMATNLARLTALNSRMILPIYRSYNNGGVPSKRGGQTFQIGPLKISGGDASTWGFRVLIFLMLGYVVLALRGMSLHIGTDGLTVEHQKRSAAEYAEHAETKPLNTLNTLKGGP